MNSLLGQSREFFCQRRESIRRAGNVQGIRRKTDPRARRIRWRRNTQVMEMKIINNMIARTNASLLRTRRASDARVEPRIKSADEHDQTETQRWTLGVAQRRSCDCCHKEMARWNATSWPTSFKLMATAPATTVLGNSAHSTASARLEAEAWSAGLNCRTGYLAQNASICHIHSAGGTVWRSPARVA